jgi:hypothetical protein
MMVLKRFALFVACVFLLCVMPLSGLAQPTLPDISGSEDKGVVLLSWNCQYAGVKAIAVLHSVDSNFNFKIIGYVKKLDKGIQAYIDGHPDTGRNYYRLSIVFNSGLTWTSNRRSVYIDISKMSPTRLVLPRNDSLQRFIVTEQRYAPGRVAVPGYELKADSEAIDEVSRRAHVARRMSLSFDADTIGAVVDTLGHVRPAVHRKITISFDEPDMTAALFIKSIYVFTDAGTGHVHVLLPDDVRRHHYSLKFYNNEDHLVLEILKINTANFLIDKRNFQKAGLFKFILRKDGLEFESGYVRTSDVAH